MATEIPDTTRDPDLMPTSELVDTIAVVAILRTTDPVFLRTASSAPLRAWVERVRHTLDRRVPISAGEDDDR